MASEFKLKSQEVVNRVEGLESMGRLTGHPFTLLPFYLRHFYPYPFTLDTFTLLAVYPFTLDTCTILPFYPFTLDTFTLLPFYPFTLDTFTLLP